MLWLVLLVNAVCGATFTFNKLILEQLSPIMYLAIRMGLSGVLLTSFSYIKNRASFKIEKEDWLSVVLLGFVTIYLSFILEFWAMQYVASAKTALIFNLTPFITALFAYWFFADKLTRKQLIGLVIGFVGMAPIFIANGDELVAGGVGFLSLPELALMTAVGTYAYGWVIMKRLLDKGYSPILLNGISMLLGGAMALPTSLFFEQAPLPPFWPLAGWIGLVILAGNVIFYNLYSYLLNFYTMTFLSFTGFTIPFFTAFISFLLLGEKIGWEFFVSSVIVMIGLYIFYQDELKEGVVKRS